MTQFGLEYKYPGLPPPSSKPFLQPPVSGGVDFFTDLLDTPNSYTGHGLKYLRVKDGELQIEFAEIPDGDKHFAHTQAIASNDWGVINHGLGKYPAIQIFNEIGEPARANVIHLTPDTAQITSDVAFAGVAYFN